ncbi:MAG: transposase [Yoonia sp.]|jgi:transposase
MEDFEVWLKTQRSRIAAKSRLGEKLSYIAKYMDGLKLFLDDGSVEMDSNIVERAIRPNALNRKMRSSRATTKAAEPGRASHR